MSGWAAAQQQHSYRVQYGQSFGDWLALHPEGRHPQSAHLISMPEIEGFRPKNTPAKAAAELFCRRLERRKSNILVFFTFRHMFETLLQQVFPAEAFPVWIPLAFGLAVGLAYAIASSMRRSK